jgi:hypothetical protein
VAMSLDAPGLAERAAKLAERRSSGPGLDGDDDG